LLGELTAFPTPTAACKGSTFNGSEGKWREGKGKGKRIERERERRMKGKEGDCCP